MRSIRARHAMLLTAFCAAALPAMGCSAGDESMNTNEALGPVLDPLPPRLAAPPPAPTQSFFPPRSWSTQLTLKHGG